LSAAFIPLVPHVERHARQIDPQIHAGHHPLGDVHFIIFEEGDAPLERGIQGGLENPLQHAFPRIVRRMCLPREDDLHGAAPIGQQAPQALGVAE
jgi:hypothetical protein